MALPQTRLLRCSGSIRTGGTRNATICLGTQRFRSCRPLPSTSASQSSVQAATMLHPAQLWRKITAPASDTLSVGSRTQDTPRRRHSEKQRFLRCCCVSGAMSAATGATTSEAIFVLGTLYCIPLIVLVRWCVSLTSMLNRMTVRRFAGKYHAVSVHSQARNKHRVLDE